ncbi:MAG: tRNA (N(6)-L-threonylcarbamoyladenosine(37)-C(2))-methylthiotransferase MtaB [Planctomycetes bacterium]|nr:tRNA (N(6)-L-threonylcarbamoyladenosine(37)-C(2))-methylthiotransferase MtaB [Planctomycetota bacterium]
MKRCAFVTLGCKVNHYDTQALREDAARRGFREAREGERADVVVVNTCTVTERAGAKSRHLVRRALREHPGATVVATGCYADSDADELAAIPGVAWVAPNRQKASLFQVLERDAGPPDETSTPATAWPGITAFEGQTRAFLKVQDGCDLHCSFCIIPAVRGTARSRPAQEILDEARSLLDAGFRELVLTGVHLGGYGKDLGGREALAKLVADLARIAKRGAVRLRLSSIEANEVTPRLLATIADSPVCCPHFHLPLQSGDDGVLRAMRRRYTASRFSKTIDAIRNRIDRPSLTTDVIVGFPGETEDAHRNTERTCEQAGFHKIHLFPYSVRRDTTAASIPGRIGPREQSKRMRSLEALEARLALAYHRSFVGTEVEVLGEEPAAGVPGTFSGYTERYVRVVFPAGDEARNALVRVRARRATPRHLFADRPARIGNEPVALGEPTHGA